MDQGTIIAVMQDAITTVLTVSAPMLLMGMLVGVIVSVFQATTQINEQTLSFVPKIIAIFLALLIFGGWILTNLSDFANRVFYDYIGSLM